MYLYDSILYKRGPTSNTVGDRKDTILLLQTSNNFSNMVRKSKFVDVVLSSYLTPFETDDDMPSRRKTKVGFARYSDGCTNGIGKDGGHAERGYGFNKER